MLGKNDDQYVITSGNALLKGDVQKITDKIEGINLLDAAGLKARYKEIIKNTQLSEKGGAGLGFVDMARKSGNKLRYDFETVNDELAFFSLKTTISRNPAAGGD